MSIKIDQLKKAIEEVLDYLNLNSLSAVNLLLGTAAQESRLGEYIEQVKGPALGIFQMEAATELDIWNNYLKYQPELLEKMNKISKRNCLLKDLKYNLAYQIAMCRIHYLRVKEKLPAHDDIKGLARYWKKYYNTRLGKGTENEFIENYFWLVTDK